MSELTRRGFIRTSLAAAAAANVIGIGNIMNYEADAAEVVQGKAGIQGFQHVAVYAVDMDKTLKWYEDMFGFKPLFVADVMEGPDKPLKLAFMKLGTGYIEILSPLDKASITPAAMNTFNHFCLRTSNAEETYKYLKSKGANMETPVIDTGIPFDRSVTDNEIFKKRGKKEVTLKIFFLRGINGERIEVMQDNIG